MDWSPEGATPPGFFNKKGKLYEMAETQRDGN